MIFQSNRPGRSLKHSKVIQNWMGWRMEAGLLWTEILLTCTCAIFYQIYNLMSIFVLKMVRFHQEVVRLNFHNYKFNMHIARSLYLIRPLSRNFHSFSSSETKPGNVFWALIRSAWRQTFPNEEDQIKTKYRQVKSQKRYSQEELDQIQADIPEYQRNAVVEVKGKNQKPKSNFKMENLIPDGIKNTVKNTEFYKQYQEFSHNLKEYLHTSDSVAVNLGNKAVNTLSRPSTSARAAELMRRYDGDFTLIELEKQSGFLFRDMYNFFLEGNVEELEKLCGERALDLLKSITKINQMKRVKPKFTEIIDISQSNHLKTVMNGEDDLPSFIFEVKIQQIYCMVDQGGRIVDGDQQRIVSSTYHFSVNYSGQHVEELGHPWKITQVSKVDELKLLV